jgi:CspA family cold shock protein
MLKILHLAIGAIALVLAFVPSFTGTPSTFLQEPNALCLALLGLLNLLFAPQLPIWHQGLRNQGQNLVYALLILATLLQGLILLAPLDVIADLPANLFSLGLTALAVLIHLLSNLRFEPRSKVRNEDLGDRETGTVKWFNTSKGFGFISRDSGDDIFVHFRAIRGEGHRVLVEGQRVEFAVMQRDKGLQAEDVIAALPSRR